MRDTKTDITEKEFYFAFGMSKMTVAKESNDFKKYELMALSELLEMIARVGDLKYAETSLTLT